MTITGSALPVLLSHYSSVFHEFRFLLNLYLSHFHNNNHTNNNMINKIQYVTWT